MLSYADDNVEDLRLDQRKRAHNSGDVYIDAADDQSHDNTLFAIAHAYTRQRQDPCESLHATHLFFLCQAAK